MSRSVAPYYPDDPHSAERVDRRGCAEAREAAMSAPDEQEVQGKRKGISRRAALGQLAAITAGVVLGRAAAQGADSLPDGLFDPMHVQGRPFSEYGVRSQFETAARVGSIGGTAGATWTPLADLYGIVTPSAFHYERHHAGVPTMDPADYRLLIHGMVERTKMYTLDDLKRFPSRSVVKFVECSGNGSRGYRGTDPGTTAQRLDGLLSTSEWTGVPLSTLLRDVGVDPRGKWLVAESFDAAAMTRSIPLEKAWDDILVAYGQNGEAIRPEQGYPVRLLIPGWEGNSQIKWLRRIEISDAPFMTKEETSKYTDVYPDGTARQFTFTMDAKSLITFPSGGQALNGPGFYEITGFAWSGRGKIDRVEISTDGARTWHLANLQDPVLSQAQTRFRYPWHWDGGEAVIMSRAMDETGYVQPWAHEVYADRGEFTSYHYNNVRAWHIDTAGAVTFVPPRELGELVA